MLYEHCGIINGVKRRQVQADISFMQSDAGGAIPLERIRDGHKVYFRYADPDFSIRKMPLNPTEIEKLKDAIHLLGRFEGLPNFDWMSEIIARFEDVFHLKGNVSGAVCFAQNPDLVGLDFFSELFDSIVNKQVLEIAYHRFSKPVKKLEIHPYQLRQYNNRWFLIGYNPAVGDKYPITTLSLDRMEGIRILSNIVYQEYRGMDFDDYFYDVVGVTVYPDKPKVRIRLKAYYPAANYLLTKPFHASQKVKERQDDYVIIELSLIPNFEFETLLLDYADQIEILEPTSLKEKIRERAERIISINS